MFVNLKNDFARSITWLSLNEQAGFSCDRKSSNEPILLTHKNYQRSVLTNLDYLRRFASYQQTHDIRGNSLSAQYR